MGGTRPQASPTAWGSWAGRYGPQKADNRPYYWANQQDAWQGTTHRDNIPPANLP